MIMSWTPMVTSETPMIMSWPPMTDWATDLQVDIQVDNIMFMAVSDVNTDHFQFGFPWEQFRHKQSTNSGSCEINSRKQSSDIELWACQQLPSVQPYHTPSFHCSVKVGCVIG